MRNYARKYNTQLVKSLHNEEQRSGFVELSVPTLSGGNAGGADRLFLGDNHSTQRKLGR